MDDSGSRDLELLLLAVQQGVLSNKQVEECLREWEEKHRDAPDSWAISSVAISKGFVTEKRVAGSCNAPYTHTLHERGDGNPARRPLQARPRSRADRAAAPRRHDLPGLPRVPVPPCRSRPPEAALPQVFRPPAVPEAVGQYDPPGRRPTRARGCPHRAGGAQEQILEVTPHPDSEK